MSAPEPKPLDYESRTDDSNNRWGPFLFRPSLPTITLFLLTAAATTWLALRHHPWQRVKVFAVADGSIRFTPSGHLLTFSPEKSANVYDPTAGRMIRSIPLDFTEGEYRFLTGGEQIVWLPTSASTATLIDIASGARQEIPLPVPRKDVRKIAPDSPRIIAESDDRRFASYMNVHTLVPGASTQPVRLKAEAWWIDFSPDGKRILTLDPRPGGGEGTALLTLLDSHTGEVVGEPIYRAEVTHPDTYFVSPSWMLIPRPSGRSGPASLDVFSARTGRRTYSLNLPTGGLPRRFSLFDCALSDDGALLARVSSFATNNLEVYDLASGNRIVSRPTRLGRKPTFFPNSHRLLCDTGTGGSNAVAIIDPLKRQPLAILPDDPNPGNHAVLLRPDGRMIAVALGASPRRVAIYAPTGKDCPESALGAFAFPQTWATAFLFGGFTLCVFRDARRAARAATVRVSPLPAIGLIGMTAVLTLAALLAACLGRAHVALIPAPLLFLSSIGLATDARVWRLITLIALSASIPWCVYRLYLLRKAPDPFPWTPLDRTYDVPRMFPMAALVLAALLTIVAITVLAIRPKRAPG